MTEKDRYEAMQERVENPLVILAPGDGDEELCEALELDLHKVGPKPGYMESIGTIRKARKPITCDSCGETIQPGDEYVRHALPPSSELGNKGWRVIRACGWWTDDCRRFWEIDKRDLSGEPHVLPV